MQHEFSEMIRNVGRLMMDVVLPGHCMACGVRTDNDAPLCSACWSKISFATEPLCQCCGLPFEFDIEGGQTCASCLASPPVFARARAVMAYDDHSRGLVLDYKHGDKTERTKAFVAMLAQAGRGLFNDCDLIVPVPLHWTRLFQRRYNQSALLALGLGKRVGIPVLADALVRKKKTAPQGHLTRSKREKNIQGAFAVKPGKGAAIKGKNILLIDDVLTTGVTVSASARTLLRAGAAKVDVLTLARVMRPL